VFESCDQGDIQPAFARGPLQHRMIVCYDRYDRFQPIPFGDFSKEGLTANDLLQVWSEDLDMHWRKVSCRPKQCRTSTKKNKICQISITGKQNEISCVVIGGNPAGFMQSVSGFQLHRMIACCDLYD
jgi:hypothetical protein